MVSKKKKILIISIMAVLLVATGVLNVVLNKGASTAQTTQSVSTISSANFFSTYKTDRQSTRSQEVLYLEAIIASEASSSDAKTKAEEMRSALIEQMDKEMVCENLIIARGFADCVVSKVNDNVNVVVNSSSLSETDINKICSVVIDVFNTNNDYIKLIPYA